VTTLLSYFWNSEIHLQWFVYCVDFGGAIIDIILCILTLAMLRKELAEHGKKWVEWMIESGALIVAVLVLVTVIGLERLGTLQEQRISNEIAETKTIATKAVKPKPIDERLRVFLDGFDPSILPRVNNGETHLEISMVAAKFSAFEILCDEAGASKYIEIHDVRTALGSKRFSWFELEINPELIKNDIPLNERRTISKEQHDKFIKCLGGIFVGKVIVVSTSMDFETRNYAEQIRKMLYDAGFTDEKMNKIFVPTGAYSKTSENTTVTLGLVDLTASPRFTGAIQHCLDEIGISAPVYKIVDSPQPTWLTSDYLLVFISKRH